MARRVAERREAPFAGSNRYYRGRAIEALRGVPPGQSLDLTALGGQIKPDFSADDLPWLCPVDAGGASGAVAPQPDPVLHLLRAPARSPQPGAPRRIGAPVRP